MPPSERSRTSCTGCVSPPSSTYAKINNQTTSSYRPEHLAGGATRCGVGPGELRSGLEAEGPVDQPLSVQIPLHSATCRTPQ